MDGRGTNAEAQVMVVSCYEGGAAGWLEQQVTRLKLRTLQSLRVCLPEDKS